MHDDGGIENIEQLTFTWLSHPGAAIRDGLVPGSDPELSRSRTWSRPQTSGGATDRPVTHVC